MTPGRVTLHRLNRAEYNNTIRDLLDVDFKPADAFPVDDAGFGFDNNGDVLSIAPVLLEKYVKSASLALHKAISADPIKPPPHLEVIAATAEGNIPKSDPKATARGNNVSGGDAPPDPIGRVFQYYGYIYMDYDFPRDGEYLFSFRGYSVNDQGNSTAQAQFYLDDKPVGDKPISVGSGLNTPRDWGTQPVAVTAGLHRVYLSFRTQTTEEQYKAALEAKANAPAPAPAAASGTGGRGGRGGRPSPVVSVTGNAVLGVTFLYIDGPLKPTPDRLPDSYHRVMAAEPSAEMTKAQAAEKIIRNFATRAYRRPATDDEVQALLALWHSLDDDDHQRDLADEMSVVLQAVLANPNFLFRVEHDPLSGEKNNVHTLDEYELASRLSYFLWSSMPDDELFDLAARGELRANLDNQIDRMLHDPKAQSLVDNFAGQWLRLRQVENVSPDPTLYPAFTADPKLRESMLKETQLFFSSIKDEDRDVFDFINANYSFVDQRLAKFYGLDDTNFAGDEFHRVTFPKNSPRGGLITQASILTLTSYNNRTSPVQRGKWVLENLLDSAPPPPPPNVPVLDNEKHLTGTLRQQMEQHRANPVCASCHERMDAIGFSLENFDAIGQWRDQDAKGVAIDASGALPDGKTFNGAQELKQILLQQKDQFCRCLADKMLTYAIGRGMEPSDKRTLDAIATELQQNGDKFSALVKAIAHSDAFQKRRGGLPADLPPVVNPANISNAGSNPQSGDQS